MIQKPFFQLVRKGESIKGVHSLSDFKYLESIGWKKMEVVKPEPKEVTKPKEPVKFEIPTFVKRK